jgi:hypothetical protein
VAYRGGAWVEAPELLSDLQGVQPPPLVELSGDQLGSVLKQIDGGEGSENSGDPGEGLDEAGGPAAGTREAGCPEDEKYQGEPAGRSRTFDQGAQEGRRDKARRCPRAATRSRTAPT